ncbi:hypothetical protein ACQZ6B_03960 [Agrobacterium vitis]
MTDLGVRSPNVAATSVLDTIIGNRKGSSRLQTMTDLAKQLAGTSPINLLGNQAPLFKTRADLAIAALASKISAWVYDDPIADNNGIWRWTGTVWEWALPLPYSFLEAEDVGAGTANAIKATSKIPVSEETLILVSLFRDTTAEPATISFNGGTPLTIKTNRGTDASALPAGMLMAGKVSGETFRLVTDEDVSVLVAQAEVARDAAEEANQAANNLVGKANTALQAPDYHYPLAQLGLPVLHSSGEWDWTAVINAAWAAGKAVLLPEGVTGVTGITPIDMSRMKGVHRHKSILKLLNGANNHIIATANFDAQFGTAITTVAPQGIVLHDFTIHGNRANNNTNSALGTVANGIALYARKPSIVNINGYNIPGHFIACDYRDTASGSIAPGGNGMLGMEGEFRNIWGDFIGGIGMWMYGPHDSFVENCHMIHTSQNANNTHAAFRFEASFSSRGRNLHCYNSGLYNNHSYGIYDEAGCDIEVSHFEGSSTANVYIKAQRAVYKSIRAYSTRDAAHNVIIGGNQNRFEGYLGGSASGDCIGIRLGLNSSDYCQNNVIDVTAVGNNAGSVDFTYSQGGNEILMVAAQDHGPMYVGTPPVAEVLDMLINGVWYRQKGNSSGNNITAGGTSSSDATALTARANRITTASGNAGVKLPSTLMLVGEIITIINSTSSTIKVYPTGSDGIEYPGNSFPAPYTLAAGKAAMFVSCYRGQWAAVLTA